MADLKPRLIITQRGRKRRGFGKLLVVLIIFAAGFYAGSKYGVTLFGSVTDANDQNISEIKGEDNTAMKGSAKEDSTEEHNLEIYSNIDNQVVEDQNNKTGSLLVGGGGFNSRLTDDNDSMINVDSFENASILSGGSESSLEDINIPENELSDGVSDDTSETKGLYTLQVGAFSTAEEAKGVADGYVAKGYKAYVVPIENSRGESWSLVKIGRFNNIEQAWSYSTYFNNREGLDAYVETLEQETVFNESWNNSEKAEIE